jgi:hypothetical protein
MLKMIETLLPDVLLRLLEKIGLRRIAAPALLGQDAPRKTNL